MNDTPASEIRIGISSCILGNKVRYNGGHTQDRMVTETLGPYVKWIPICPEVEIGLGIPRETLHLQKYPEGTRLVSESGIDLTEKMQTYAERRVEQIAKLRLHGYILMSKSPSCGMERVKLYPPGKQGMSEKKGVGIFARVLLERLPQLPVEEEGRLHDPLLRENFIERIFANFRWQAFLDSKPRPGDLVRFHSRYKMTLLAHRPAGYTDLGRLVAQAGDRARQGEFGQILEEYGRAFMDNLRIKASRARHTNVLQHLAGHLKKVLDDADRAEMTDCIEQYRLGLVPLVVPMTLLKHHFRRNPAPWATDQTYLDPYPVELMLRNHV